MTHPEIIGELAAITARFTSPDLKSSEAVAMAYIEIDQLRNKLAAEVRRAMFADGDPGFERVVEQDHADDPEGRWPR